MTRHNHYIIIILISVLFFGTCYEGKIHDFVSPQSIEDCLACERISLFYDIKDLVDDSIWRGLNDTSYVTPILYFTDSSTYVAFAKNEIFSSDMYRQIRCDSGIELKRLHDRLDGQLFHMENKMSFKDTTSIFYFRPMMLCSDVETMHQFVPDFDKTEDWLQLVMHEYFHSFQFSHPKIINYFANTIQISADTLNAIYLDDAAFRSEIKNENELLLKALETQNEDSLKYYINEFHSIRNNRRINYELQNGFDLSTAENFWETIEGTARYTEYYMAGKFGSISRRDINKCDTLFQNFNEYSELENFEKKEKFIQRTMVMPAYYYVTGFNICRLMDKLSIEYKSVLFKDSYIGLYEILIKGSH